MSLKQINESLNALPSEIDAALSERKAARPSRRRAAHIKATEHDAIIRALGESARSDRILAVAEKFNRGVSTILKMKRAAGI